MGAPCTFNNDEDRKVGEPSQRRGVRGLVGLVAGGGEAEDGTLEESQGS
jgi:hypothetical protein